MHKGASSSQAASANRPAAGPFQPLPWTLVRREHPGLGGAPGNGNVFVLCCLYTFYWGIAYPSKIRCTDLKSTA